MVEYKAVPDNSNKFPSGIWYIILNDTAMLTSYKGILAVLYPFLIGDALIGDSGALAMNHAEARSALSLFNFACYFMAIVGAFLTEWCIGKYSMILYSTLLCCIAHAVLMWGHNEYALLFGLAIYSIGAGGIKSSTIPHGFDQFNSNNSYMMDRMMGIFIVIGYIGGFLSNILGPELLYSYGSWAAFSFPFILMVIALIVFYVGRYQYVHKPPSGDLFWKKLISKETRAPALKVSTLCVFFSLYCASSGQAPFLWIEQASRMDLDLFFIELLPSQVGAIEVVCVCIVMCIYLSWLRPWFSKMNQLNYSMIVGYILMIMSYVYMLCLDIVMLNIGVLNIVWQFPMYILFTSSFIVLYTSYERTIYNIVPKYMKTLACCAYPLGYSLGNLITFLVNTFIIDSSESMFHYDMFFIALSTISVLIFYIVQRRVDFESKIFT